MPEANGIAAPPLETLLDIFSNAAIKYKQKYKKTPVLIIDNANRIAKEELEQIQDYAKDAADKRRATLVFVSSEGHVPRHMMGKLISFVNCCAY